MLNTLISPGYSLIKAHLRHIAPNHNHCSISAILLFIPQDSRCQKKINNIYNRSSEQSIIVQATIEANKKEIKSNKQDSDDKMMKLTEDFKAMLA